MTLAKMQSKRRRRSKSEQELHRKWKTLDRRLVRVARSIKVLTKLSWPVRYREKFFKELKKGNLSLPKVRYREVDYEDEREELSSIISEADGSPAGEFIRSTAESYLRTIAMLDSVGTPAFTDHSVELYGLPTDNILSTPHRHVDAAEQFIELTNSYVDSCKIPIGDVCVLPAAVAESIEEASKEFDDDFDVKAIVDQRLAAKAAAGASRIRVRSSTAFSRTEVSQLIQHELMVHTLTARNGRSQKLLRSLGLSSPRSTRTQEGLATFAELVTRTMDINRLRKIALRVKAVDMGRQGADFIELFKFFQQSGQSDLESYQSAYRVFRGGDVRGRTVFTKDCVYLAGLAEVHTFLRKAIQENKLEYLHCLFAGRLTLSDVFLLEDLFVSGLVNPPRYEPPWLQDRPTLTAFLLYSTFLNLVPLDKIALKDFARPQ